MKRVRASSERDAGTPVLVPAARQRGCGRGKEEREEATPRPRNSLFCLKYHKTHALYSILLRISTQLHRYPPDPSDVSILQTANYSRIDLRLFFFFF